jgi:hypothetical protein
MSQIGSPAGGPTLLRNSFTSFILELFHPNLSFTWLSITASQYHMHITENCVVILFNELMKSNGGSINLDVKKDVMQEVSWSSMTNGPSQEKPTRSQTGSQEQQGKGKLAIPPHALDHWTNSWLNLHWQHEAVCTNKREDKNIVYTKGIKKGWGFQPVPKKMLQYKMTQGGCKFHEYKWFSMMPGGWHFYTYKWFSHQKLSRKKGDHRETNKKKRKRKHKHKHHNHDAEQRQERNKKNPSKNTPPSKLDKASMYPFPHVV